MTAPLQRRWHVRPCRPAADPRSPAAPPGTGNAPTGPDLAAVLTVIYLDYSSEVAKLARGAYTDTFSPLGLGRAAAWPGSYLGPISVYPDGPFDAIAYRAELQPSLHACLRAAVVQAVLVFLICAAIQR